MVTNFHEWLKSKIYSEDEDFDWSFNGPNANKPEEDEPQQARPMLTLYRGIAGQPSWHDEEQDHYFTNDVNMAKKFARDEAKRQKLPPFLIKMLIPSQIAQRYFKKWDTYGREVYDIPTQIVNAYKAQHQPLQATTYQPNVYQNQPTRN